jgi:hypothetical protein
MEGKELPIARPRWPGGLEDTCRVSKAESALSDQTSIKMPCGMYVAAPIRAVRAEHLIHAKGIEPSISAPNGVPMYDRVSQR